MKWQSETNLTVDVCHLNLGLFGRSVLYCDSFIK